MYTHALTHALHTHTRAQTTGPVCASRPQAKTADGKALISALEACDLAAVNKDATAGLAACDAMLAAADKLG